MREICSICNNNYIFNLSIPKAVTFDDYPLSGNFSLAYCTVCDFAWNNSESIDSNYIDYYTNYNKH